MSELNNIITGIKSLRIHELQRYEHEGVGYYIRRMGPDNFTLTRGRDTKRLTDLTISVLRLYLLNWEYW